MTVPNDFDAITHNGDQGEDRFGSLLVREYQVSPDLLFNVWVDRFDEWFAERGAITRQLEPGAPYFFETIHAGQRHPHYGRILAFQPGKLIEMTWLNEAGTRGVETVVRVEVRSSDDGGSQLRLTHSGFRDKDTSSEHANAWSGILKERLEPVLYSRD